jgi:ribosome-associated heat shock protein Hsp15
MEHESGRIARVRIDKWLWAARFFKTRSLASRACELGRILCNGQPAKPSREVRVGDELCVRNEVGDFQLKVLAVSGVRGPAAIAQTLYAETEASKESRRRKVEERKAMQLQGEPPREYKPSKRDRRQLQRFRGRR